MTEDFYLDRIEESFFGRFHFKRPLFPPIIFIPFKTELRSPLGKNRYRQSRLNAPLN